jgi:hypothetical protein
LSNGCDDRLKGGQLRGEPASPRGREYPDHYLYY